MKNLLNRRLFIYGVLIFSAAAASVIISCKSADKEGTQGTQGTPDTGAGYTKCEEMCEYEKRDCIENCENYRSFGFSIDLSGPDSQTIYACTEKCIKNSDSCLQRCGKK